MLAKLFLVFFLGLCWGSFLNVLIYRFKDKKSFLKGRSYCPHCHHYLGILDLIPLFSFIFLKGRCRYCHQKISWQYPLVEFFTGLLFLLSVSYSNFQSVSHPYLLIFRNFLFISFFLIIFVYDLRYSLIPDEIILSGIVLAFIFNLLLGYSWDKLALAGLIGSGFFLLQYLISQGKWIGFGDVKLGLLIGFFVSWPKILLVLFFAYLFGAIIGSFLLLTKKRNLKSEIPFGPFLVFATFITLFWGEQIVCWFKRLIG